MNLPTTQIDPSLIQFINTDVLPLTQQDPNTFWLKLNDLVNTFVPQGSKLLDQRQALSAIEYVGQPSNASTIHRTAQVDSEISNNGPQLTVPLNNARFALNAINGRWGSLYDVLYGTDVIAQTPGLKVCKKYNQARGNHVISYAKQFLDQTFPLASGSHQDVTSYLVYYQHLLAMFPDGTTQGLSDPCQFRALSGHKSEPTTLALKNRDLHVIIEIDRNGPNGNKDLAGIDDILIEATQIAQLDFALPLGQNGDQLTVYRNWLGLIQGDLTAQFEKQGTQITRCINKDKHFTSKDGDDYRLPGKALLIARHGDLLSDIGAGIVDTVLTALIGSLDLQQKTASRNSRVGNIYMIKAKLQGPEEVRFVTRLFEAIESMLNLPTNALKLAISDEEQRTSINLKACFDIAGQRLIMLEPVSAATPSAAVLQTLQGHKLDDQQQSTNSLPPYAQVKLAESRPAY